MADFRHDDFEDPAGEDWGDADESYAQPRRSSRGRGWLIAIIVILVLVALAVLCCGGAMFWFYSGIEMTSRAQTIRAWTDQLLAIEIPDDYSPVYGSRMPVFGFMTYTTVSYDGPGGMRIHLVEAVGPFPNDAASRAQLAPSLRNFIGQIPAGRGKLIQAESSEIREVTINGQTIDFHLASGPAGGTGETWRELTGTVPGRRGIVYVAIQAPKEDFDEKAAMTIVKSIGGAEEEAKNAEQEAKDAGQPEQSGEPAAEGAGGN